MSETWKDKQSGTYIFMNDVNLKRTGDKAFESLERRLSNYFLYNKLGSSIFINIIKKDSDVGEFRLIQKKIAYKNMIQIYSDNLEEFSGFVDSSFSVSYKDKLNVEQTYTGSLEINLLSDVIDSELLSGEIDGVPYQLNGWIGIHCTIDSEEARKNDKLFIRNQFYNPNQIRVYARNKLGMANFIEHLGITRAFANYIEGEIVFDILDDSRLPDISTAGRQDYDIHDERIQELKKLLVKLGNNLVAKRQSLADKIKKEKESTDKKISSESKKIFMDGLDEWLSNEDEVEDELRNKLEHGILNMLEGEVEVKSKYTVFISHASKDRIISDFFYFYLTSLGFNGDIMDDNCEIFYSSNGLDFDNLEPLSKVIKDFLIDKNNEILFLTSENFNNSQYCMFEGGAAWATKALGDYKIVSFDYKNIPTFLTNGKNEVVLNIHNSKDFILDIGKYNGIVSAINKMIFHLNKNKKVRGQAEVSILERVIIPDEVQLKAMGKAEKDFMDKTLLEYWETYVESRANEYFGADSGFIKVEGTLLNPTK